MAGRPTLQIFSYISAVLISLPGLAATAGAQVPELDPAQPALPHGGVTIGAGGGEEEFQAFGDVLVPLWFSGGGMSYLNPRFSRTDSDEKETSIGLGYRHWFRLDEQDFILGANIFYDNRWTASDGSFDQVGFGLEFLSEWVDARANYYLPEEDETVVDTEEQVTEVQGSSALVEQRWGDIYGEDHAVRQDLFVTATTMITTTRQIFNQYEAAMEGFDGEIGVKLPYADQWMVTRVFIGYQSFDDPYGSDYEGLKGRLEIRAAPGLFLDAEYFEEEELNGMDYYVGGRVRIPFDLANLAEGRSPFEGCEDAFRIGKGAFVNRMTEMVVRDMKVRTRVSDYIEDLSRREVTRENRRTTQRVKYTLMDGLEVVDGDNVADPREDGTFEHPYDTIQEGVDAAGAPGSRTHTAYVREVTDADDRYRENVRVHEGVAVVSSALPLTGAEGKTFGGTGKPVVDGLSRGPTFTLADNTALYGLEVRNSIRPAASLAGIADPRSWAYANGTVYYTRRAGVFGRDVSSVAIENVDAYNNSYGALLVSRPEMGGTFAPVVLDSTFSYNSSGGLLIEGSGVPWNSSFFPYLEGNTFSANAGMPTSVGFPAQRRGDGLVVRGRNYGEANVFISNTVANANAGDGIRVAVNTWGGPAYVTLDGARTSANGWGDFLSGRADGDGVDVDALAVGSGDAIVGIGDVVSRLSNNDGIQAGANAFGLGGAGVEVRDSVTAFNFGPNTGVDVVARTIGTGDAVAMVTGVTSYANIGHGVRARTRATGTGDAFTGAYDLRSFLNTGHGVSLTAISDLLGDAIADAEDVVTAGSGISGVDVLVAANGFGDALADLHNVQAIGSLSTGIAVSAVANLGDSSVWLEDATVAFSGTRGVDLNSMATVADAFAGARNVTSIFSGDDGLDMDVNGLLSADAYLSNVVVFAAAQEGVDVDAFAFFQTAEAEIEVIRTAATARNGISTWVSSVNGRAAAEVRDAVTAFTGGDGVTATVIGDQPIRGREGQPGAELDIVDVTVLGAGGAGVRANVFGNDSASGFLWSQRAADLTISGVRVYGSGSDGVSAFVSAFPGNSAADISDVVTVFSGEEGLDVAVWGEQATWGRDGQPAAELDIAGVTVIGAAGDGIRAHAWGNSNTEGWLWPQRATDVTITDATVLGAGANGISARATSFNGSAALEIRDSVTILAAQNGLAAEVDGALAVWGTNGQPAAELDIVNALAVGSGWTGIYMNVVGQQGRAGAWPQRAADVTVDGAAAIGSGYDGIAAHVTGVDGEAQVEMRNALSLFSGDDGIDLEVTTLGGTGDVEVTMHSVFSAFSGDDGVDLELTSGEDVELMLLDTLAAFNAEDGVRLELNANDDVLATVSGVVSYANQDTGLTALINAGGRVRLFGRDSWFRDNAGVGIFIDASGGTVVLDFGAPGAPGNNWIEGNDTAGMGFQVSNASPPVATLRVYSNWWGDDTVEPPVWGDVDGHQVGNHRTNAPPFPWD